MAQTPTRRLSFVASNFLLSSPPPSSSASTEGLDRRPRLVGQSSDDGIPVREMCLSPVAQLEQNFGRTTLSQEQAFRAHEPADDDECTSDTEEGCLSFPAGPSVVRVGSSTRTVVHISGNRSKVQITEAARENKENMPVNQVFVPTASTVNAAVDSAVCAVPPSVLNMPVATSAIAATVRRGGYRLNRSFTTMSLSTTRPSVQSEDGGSSAFGASSGAGSVLGNGSVVSPVSSSAMRSLQLGGPSTTVPTSIFGPSATACSGPSLVSPASRFLSSRIISPVRGGAISLFSDSDSDGGADTNVDQPDFVDDISTADSGRTSTSPPTSMLMGSSMMSNAVFPSLSMTSGSGDARASPLDDGFNSGSGHSVRRNRKHARENSMEGDFLQDSRSCSQPHSLTRFESMRTLPSHLMASMRNSYGGVSAASSSSSSPSPSSSLSPSGSYNNSIRSLTQDADTSSTVQHQYGFGYAASGRSSVSVMSPAHYRNPRDGNDAEYEDPLSSFSVARLGTHNVGISKEIIVHNIIQHSQSRASLRLSQDIGAMMWSQSSSTLLPLLKQGRVESFIKCETVAALMNGSYSKVKKFLVFDCRYKYEFDGGHIRDALNTNCPLHLINQLTSDADIDEQTVIILHCEFSSERAPKMWRLLRELDRSINTYPHLSWPNLYVMEGGYKAFFNENRCDGSLCVPNQYVPMSHEDHRNELMESKRVLDKLYDVYKDVHRQFKGSNSPSSS